jgi:HSP20 family molecular chaperone IbpA
MPVTLNSSEILSSGFQDRGDHYELKLKVSDIKNSKIDISTENSMLNIKITQNRKEESTKGNYGKIITYNNSTSMQSFTLPPDADALKIEAKESGDIITVTLPKKSGSRKIEIKKVSNSTKENNSSN